MKKALLILTLALCSNLAIHAAEPIKDDFASNSKQRLEIIFDKAEVEPAFKTRMKQNLNGSGTPISIAEILASANRSKISKAKKDRAQTQGLMIVFIYVNRDNSQKLAQLVDSLDMDGAQFVLSNISVFFKRQVRNTYGSLGIKTFQKVIVAPREKLDSKGVEFWTTSILFFIHGYGNDADAQKIIGLLRPELDSIPRNDLFNRVSQISALWPQHSSEIMSWYFQGYASSEFEIKSSLKYLAKHNSPEELKRLVAVKRAQLNESLAALPTK